MMEKNIVKAVNKNVRSGARKANVLLNFIKGKSRCCNKRSRIRKKKVAEDIKKTIQIC